MIPYYLLTFIPISIYLIGDIKGKKLNKICISVFFIILLIMLSLRSIECGTDLKNYLYYFETLHLKSITKISSEFLTLDLEIFFILLTKIVFTINNNFNFYLFIIALISIIPILLLYRKKSTNAILTIVLFISVFPFSMYFSGLRQVIAIGIVVLSYRYIQQKKILKFIVTIIIASLFHQSAIFMIVLYPLYYTKITKKWLYFIIPSIILILLFNKQIFSIIMNLPTFKYSERYSTVESTGSYTYLFMLIIFDIMCFLLPDKNKIDREFIGLRNFLLFSTYLQCFASVNYIIMRLNYYTLIFLPVLIPKVFSFSTERNKKVMNNVYLAMIVFFLFYFFYNAYCGEDILNIFPYIPFWKE